MVELVTSYSSSEVVCDVPLCCRISWPKLIVSLFFSDAVSMDSENRNVNAERVTAGRQRIPGGTNAFRVIDKPSTPPKHEHGTWVSPSNVLRKRSKEDLPRPVREPEVPTSPKRIRSSPHRVVDNPRPEDSRGDWVPMKEVRQTAHQFSFRGKFQSAPGKVSALPNSTVDNSATFGELLHHFYSRVLQLITIVLSNSFLTHFKDFVAESCDI